MLVLVHYFRFPIFIIKYSFRTFITQVLHSGFWFFCTWKKEIYFVFVNVGPYGLIVSLLELYFVWNISVTSVCLIVYVNNLNPIFVFSIPQISVQSFNFFFSESRIVIGYHKFVIFICWLLRCRECLIFEDKYDEGSPILTYNNYQIMS